MLKEKGKRNRWGEDIIKKDMRLAGVSEEIKLCGNWELADSDIGSEDKGEEGEAEIEGEEEESF